MNRDLVKVIDELSRDKNIRPEVLKQVFEDSISKLVTILHGSDWNVKTSMVTNNDNYEIKSVRLLNIVEGIPQDTDTEISIEDARTVNKSCKVGEILELELPKVEMNRTNMQSLIGIFTAKIQELQRQSEYEQYQDRVGEMVHGVFKRREGGNIIIDIGKVEAMILRNQLLPPWENFNYNDSVSGYIYEVRQDKRLPQILVSRTHPNFVAKLFEQEVTEIANGTIEIKAIAREAGSKTKIAVYSEDKSVSSVGTCIGVRGFRVNSIIKELKGEKIDVLNWDPNIGVLAANALFPGEVLKVVVNEQKDKIEVVVKEDQLNIIIGPGGQNVRLASKLIGKDIEIMTEQQESDQRKKDMQDAVDNLISQLDVDEMIAQLLYSEDFCTVDDILSVSLSELEKIDGFNEDIAKEIQDRAKNYKKNEQIIKSKELKDLGVSEDIMNIKHMNHEIAVLLGKNGIKNSSDLADLSIDELIDSATGILRNLKIKESIADEMIMDARAPWFKEKE